MHHRTSRAHPIKHPGAGPGGFIFLRLLSLCFLLSSFLCVCVHTCVCARACLHCEATFPFSAFSLVGFAQFIIVSAGFLQGEITALIDY